MNKRKPFFLMIAMLLVGLLAGGSLQAQTQFGTISGRVTDATGAAVPDAKVVVNNQATNVKQETSSNEEGLFVLANVVAGNYEIVAEKENFKRTARKVTVEVAQRLSVDLQLELGQVSETVTVESSALQVNTTSGDASSVINSRQLEVLPLLTRNPYALVALAPTVADTATSNGDTRGLGLSVGGQRTSSINFMLDGSENNETFVTGPSTIVPLDAVQEFRVQTNSMTSEFGRNALVTNVITKSGTNEFHGSVYEYYRGSALSSTPTDDKARGLAKSNFVRNQFGASGGGAIFPDKTFYFAAFEGLQVRSSANNIWWVPTTDFVNNSSSTMVSYLNAFGGIPTSNASTCMTAAQVITSETGLATYGTGAADSLFQSGTANLIPAATSLFCQTITAAPADAGGGTAQDTWSVTAKVDHHFSDRTTLSGRWAWYDQKFPVGAGSDSPYAQFRTPATFNSQNVSLTLTHMFTPTLFSESRIGYSRTIPDAPLGQAPVTAPCTFYLNNTGTPDGSPIVFPGYLPSLCFAFSIPSGGPQNTYTFYEGFTKSIGRHTWKWGGYFSHLRDNHTFGAIASGTGFVGAAQGLLDGVVDTLFQVAIDPRGKFPGQTYNPNVDGPFQSPSFTRHFRYNELAFYGEDQIKLMKRLTLTLGLRWEYFGVLHSPDREKFLDSNLYLDAVGSTPAQQPGKTIFEQVRDARFQRTSNFFNQDWNNFAPRIGFAYDVFGNNRTVFRGGYGLFYDKNFGNALFNAIQNFPNYAVVQVGGAPNVTIDVNQFNTLTALANAAGGNLALAGSARMLDRELVTAYSQQWNATVEHDVLGKGIIASLSYIGAKGDKLYSLNNLNQRGSCLLLVQVTPAAPCNPAGGNSSRINQSGLTGMNRRGNEGFSRYHAMAVEVRTKQIANSGLTLSGNHTWAHSIDNASSFFNDSAFDGTGRFGFRDPYNPALDRADSSNDIRHRFTLSYNWEIPWGKNLTGALGHVASGWNLTGIYQAQTGGTFSVYDYSASQCNTSATNACYPLLTGSAPSMDGRTPVSGAPNRYVLYDVSNMFQTQQSFCATNTLNGLAGTACTAALVNLHPELQSGRNLFRAPGFWNWDLAVLKNFRLPWESMGLQFRAEFFNLVNHSNLYADPNTNLIFANAAPGAPNTVNASRGVRPGNVFGVAVDRRNIQLALRLTW